MLSSPWGVMKVLGLQFGYEIPTMPMIGRCKSDAGERRTCIFTLQRK